MPTRQIKFTNHIEQIGPIDKVVQFDTPLRFMPNKEQTMQLIYGQITGVLPNVFSYGTWNNTVVRVSQDNGTSWSEITLRPGNYQVGDVSYAINETISDWYTNPDIPAFKLESNVAEEKCYITIDSTKLKVAGQFCIDFSYSDIWKTLGFETVKSFNTDGQFAGSHIPDLDHFGYFMDINIDGFGDLSISNSSVSNSIAICPLTSSTGSYEINRQMTTASTLNTLNEVRSYTIKFVGARENRQIIFAECDLVLVFELKEF